VIGKRVGDGRLVAVEAGQMESVVEITRQRGQDAVIGDRTEDETNPRISRNVGNIGGHEVVHHDDFARILLEYLMHQIAADKTSAADDQNLGVNKCV
jgi:hypothetical protein